MSVWRVSTRCAWKGDNVQIVEEDPEYFFCYVCNFFAPDAVGTRASHIEDEADWALGLIGYGVSKIRQECPSSIGTFG